MDTMYKRLWSRRKRGTIKESLSKSCTWKGRRGEFLAMNFLKTAIDKNKGTLNYSFDLEWMNKKIDVKSCNLYFLTCF